MTYPESQEQAWVPDRLRKRKRDESKREGQTTGREGEGIVEGHPNLSPLGGLQTPYTF